MDIGERGGAGCGLEGRIILPDSGRDTREGIGEVVMSSLRIAEREFSQIRRSLIHDIE
jgi:hypothetical protein